MTILEYILEKYRAMGVNLSEAYVQTLLVGKVNMHEDVYTYGGDRAHRVFIESLPEFLLMPSSVSELGVSIAPLMRQWRSTIEWSVGGLASKIFSRRDQW